MASQLDANHPFSTTSIIRKNEEGFVKQGDILNITEEDLADISNENYVYCNYYAMEKTRLSQKTYVPVGAIILGTKDEKAKEELHFASLRSRMKSHEEEKNKQNQ